MSKYDEVSNFSEGLAGVKLNGKYRVIDKTGKEVIPCQYDQYQLDSIRQQLKPRCEDPKSLTSEELLKM